MTDPARSHDPGGRVRLALPDGVTGDAEFSSCGRYRQALTRDWTAPGAVPRVILFIGMNPSVADASASDPTCHRELMFAQGWGYSRYLKGNVLDWRATTPRDIPQDPDVACSAANLPALARMAAEADTIVMAHGRLPPRFHRVLQEVIRQMHGSGTPLMCLGLNKDGSAKHPLYLRKDTPLQPLPATR